MSRPSSSSDRSDGPGKREYYDDDLERREYLDDYYRGQGYRGYTHWRRDQDAVDDDMGW